jgi:hypothetical protein
MPETLANAASPPPAAGNPPAPAPRAADPGEFAPSAAPRPAPGPSAPENLRPRGTYEQRRFAQDQARGETPPQPAADQQQPPAAETGPKVKVGKFEVSETELAAMMDRQSQEDLRAATRPASAEAYEARLPADLKLPGGQEYKFDVNDPSLIAARNLAHAKGWSQSDFSEALGIFASHIAGQEAQLAERSRAEIEKAGVNAPQRVAIVGRWITAEVGEADARPIRATIITDAHLRFYEKLMNKISSQGAASFSQSHRVPPDDNKIPGYDKMSFEQRRLAQDQRAARERGR